MHATKNEISDDEASRDYKSHDVFRVYEFVVLLPTQGVEDDNSRLTLLIGFDWVLTRYRMEEKIRSRLFASFDEFKEI